MIRRLEFLIFWVFIFISDLVLGCAEVLFEYEVVGFSNWEEGIDMEGGGLRVGVGRVSIGRGICGRSRVAGSGWDLVTKMSIRE